MKSGAFLGYILLVPTWRGFLVIVAVRRGREVDDVEAVGLGVGLPAAATGDARAQDEAGAEVVAASGGAVGAAEVRHLREEGEASYLNCIYLFHFRCCVEQPKYFLVISWKFQNSLLY